MEKLTLFSLGNSTLAISLTQIGLIFLIKTLILNGLNLKLTLNTYEKVEIFRKKDEGNSQRAIFKSFLLKSTR